MRSNLTQKQEDIGAPMWPNRCGNSAIAIGMVLVLSSVPLASFAQAQTESSPPAIAEPATPVSYRITSGDTIAIEVFGKPELSRALMVGVDGKITYPFLGDVQANGQTVTELSKALEKKLARELNNPQVTVTVIKRRITRVGILGAVRQPGKFVLEDGWHVLDLLAESGGLLVDRPEWVQATLVRAATGTSVPIDFVRLLSTADTAQNPLLEPGDVLLVREKDAVKTRVQVLGAVAKPGLVTAPTDGSILSAILDVGGVVPRAKLADAVIRRNGETIPVDLSGLGTDGVLKPVNGKPIPTLQPGDTLLIPTNVLSYSVIGSVATPGTREFPNSKVITAVTALFQAGGALPDGDLKKASIVRLNAAGQADVFPINLDQELKDNAKGEEKGAQVLLPGDVLYLPSKQQGRDRMTGVRDALSFLPFAGFFLR